MTSVTEERASAETAPPMPMPHKRADARVLGSIRLNGQSVSRPVFACDPSYPTMAFGPNRTAVIFVNDSPDPVEESMSAAHTALRYPCRNDLSRQLAAELVRSSLLWWRESEAEWCESLTSVFCDRLESSALEAIRAAPEWATVDPGVVLSAEEFERVLELCRVPRPATPALRRALLGDEG